MQKLPPSHNNAERPTAQAKATPRPDPSLLLGGPACRSPGVRSQQAPQGQGVQASRLPAPKRLKPLKPLKPLKLLKPLKRLKFCKRVSERPTAQAKATPKPHQCGTPNRAGKSYPKARSIASSGRPACRSPGVRSQQAPQGHIQWLLMGVQACRLPAPKRLKPLKPLKPFKTFKTLQKRLGSPNRAVRQAFAANRHPKATSMASYGRPSLPTGTPRPHQWLLMGVQACRLPAPKRLKPLKPLKPVKPLKRLKLCKRVSERPTAQAKATPRPDPSLLLGGPACRSPGVRSQQAPQGHINGFLWASKPAVCQPLNA